MQSKLRRILTKPLLPHLPDQLWRPVRGYAGESIGSIVSVVVLVLFFYLGVRKLGSLALTESQLFFGLLLLLAVFMMGFCLVLLLQMFWPLRQRLDAPGATRSAS